MPKFEVTLDGFRTLNYTYSVVIEAEDEEDAQDKAEELEPLQNEWILADFENPFDKEIESDGVASVEPVIEQAVTSGRTGIKYIK